MTDLEIRQARRAAMRGVAERRFAARFEHRFVADGSGGSLLRVGGYASVTDTPYDMVDIWGDEYRETIERGAFARTLSMSPDVPLLIGHNMASLPLARTKSGTLQLAEDSTGLEWRADLDMASPLVQATASAMERGDLDGMSFGFMALRQEWSPDYTERRIQEVDIHRGDVSLVVFGANPAASAGVQRTDQRAPTQPYTPDPADTQDCPQCQSGNAADASFCDQCGAVLLADPLSATGEETLSRARLWTYLTDLSSFD